MRHRQFLIGTLVALGAVAPIATAAAAAGAAPTVPPETASIPLFNNLGSYHREVTTKSPLAQRFFDQGLTLVYGFNHEEAIRSFKEAARLDPDCAMAWWGVSYALGPNINMPIDPEMNRGALEALATAQSLAAKGSDNERAWIAALAKRYSADPAADRARLDRAFADAMGEVSRSFPDDLDAAVIHAESLMDLRPWKLWTADGLPEEGTERIVAILESVLRRAPDHPGANHYYIHAVEASTHPERALASASRLPALVPGAGHLVHMPAHIYMRTGNYAGASKANQDAADVDEAYIKRTGGGNIYPLMYYPHNLHFLAVSRCMEGNLAGARQAAETLAAQVLPHLDDMPMIEFAVPTTWLIDLRFGRWDDVLAAKEPEARAAIPSARALRHFARGVAFAAKGDVKSAEAERDAFAALRSQVGADTPWGVVRSVDVLAVAAETLEARLAAARGDRSAAVEHWRSAVKAGDAVGYDEPPPWYLGPREGLGAALLRAGRPAEAEAVFRADLERNPNNGRSLFGLAEALQAQKKTREADEARRRFTAAWQGADVTLTVDGL
jgi:tetratricopeptide (TPR) repeat protein